MKTVTASQLKEMIDKEELLLLDVREPGEYASECINGAYLLPVNKISTEKLEKTSKICVAYCSCGNRSKVACQKLSEIYPSLEIYGLEGGLSAWKKAGYPTKSSGRKVLPLERQVMLSAGFFVFFGVILAIFVNKIFYIIPGFIGLGLMFAGLTGLCGMSKILAKMPWNR